MVAGVAYSRCTCKFADSKNSTDSDKRHKDALPSDKAYAKSSDQKKTNFTMICYDRVTWCMQHYGGGGYVMIC